LCMSFEIFIARRYLKARQRTSFISLISIISIMGIFLGVAALNIVMAVMNGFKEEVTNRLVNISGHIYVIKYGRTPIKNYREIQEKIKSVPGVAAAVPFIQSKVLLSSGNYREAGIVWGMNPDELPLVSEVDKSIKEGLYQFQGTHYPGVILGSLLADNLHAQVGEEITLGALTSRDQLVISPFGMPLRLARFQVMGLMETGMFDYDSQFVYMTLKEAQSLFRMGDSATGILVKINDLYKAHEMSQLIVDRLGGPPFLANNWIDLNKPLFEWLSVEKRVMFIIMILIVMVAAFGIVSTLFMLVMEKVRDIGVLKSLGASSRAIRKIFVMVGMTIGILGTVSGSLAGYIVCVLLKKYKFITIPGDFYFINRLPVKVEFFDLLVIALAALLIAFLSTIYPARRAARLSPVEAIRYE